MNTNYSLDTYIMISVIISFLGFCLENIWLCFRKGYIDNRNMSLPFLLGYSFAVLGFYIVLGTPDRPSSLVQLFTERFDYFSYCVTVFLLVSIGEIILGKSVELVCGIHYWDYTSLPLHITRYTSVMTSIAFSFIITKFMKLCFIPIINILSKIEFRAVIHFFRVIYISMIIDFLVSFYRMYKTKALNERWQKQMFERKNSEISDNG